MSIQSEIDRIKGNVASAYSAVDERGGVVPEARTSDNLAAAVRSVPAAALPSGCVVIWSGEKTKIPDGWALCDGTNGTPDLRNRFVLGAGGSYTVRATGGSEEVTLTVDQMPSHTHPLQATSAVTSGGSMDISIQRVQRVPVDIDATTKSAGSSKPHPNMPPYYALCYIMKI